MTKNQIVIGSIGGIIIYAVPNIIYLLLHSCSGDIGKWGQYGDFIGGVLNPFLTLINIGAFIFLTYKISDIEEKRNKLTLKTQKVITITQMRYECVLRLEAKLEKIEFEWRNSFGKVLEIQKALIDFKMNEGYLFGALINGFPESTYEPFLKVVEDIFNKEREFVNMSIQEKYYIKKVEFINDLKNFILNELD